MLPTLAKSLAALTGVLLASAGFAQSGSDDSQPSQSSQPSQAPQTSSWSVEAGVGRGLPSDGRYDDTDTQYGALNYRYHQWIAQVGRIALGDAALRDSTSDVGMVLDGNYLLISRRLTLPWQALRLEVGGGAIHAQSRAYVVNHKLGSASHISPVAGISLSIDVNRHLALLAGTRYHWDISGSDMLTPYGALRFRF